jgi:hypothetical protein
MVIMFRVSPEKYMKRIVMMMETGILMPMIRVGFHERRKTKRIKIASRAPEIAVEVTSFREFSI